MDILQTTSVWPLLLAALFAFAESAVGVGMLFPGEAAITALAATLEGNQRLLAIFFIVLGATAGDHTGYLLGRHFGARLPSSRLIRRIGPERWIAATRLIERHGAPAVFVSRLLPFVRTVMPAVAGVAGLRYAKFAAASIAGSILWATLWVSAGGVVSALGLLQSPTTLGILGLSAAVILVAAVLRHRTAKPWRIHSSMTSRRNEEADIQPFGPQSVLLDADRLDQQMEQLHQEPCNPPSSSTPSWSR